jgi:molybdate-binding protein
LRFLPYQEERYDFAVPKNRRDHPAVRKFVELLSAQSTRQHLAQLGFNTQPISKPGSATPLGNV